jgi:hypothetical protein
MRSVLLLRIKKQEMMGRGSRNGRGGEGEPRERRKRPAGAAAVVPETDDRRWRDASKERARVSEVATLQKQKNGGASALGWPDLVGRHGMEPVTSTANFASSRPWSPDKAEYE